MVRAVQRNYVRAVQRCNDNAITYNFDFAILTLLGTEIAEIRHDAVAIYLQAMDSTRLLW